MKIGDRVGKLEVLYEVERLRIPSRETNRAFMCKCDCGTTKVVRLVHLSRNRITSCGCNVSIRNGRGNSILCKTWRSMKYRCSEKYFEKHLYFEKGICVCEEWKNDYFAFEKWSLENGFVKGLQIDRTDNSKGYSPSNCRWVTPKINCNNRDNTIFVCYKGDSIALKMLLQAINKESSYNLIVSRIRRGWNHEKAIDTPARIGNYKRNNITHAKK